MIKEGRIKKFPIFPVFHVSEKKKNVLIPCFKEVDRNVKERGKNI
jgi:hypothetical protein